MDKPHKTTNRQNHPLYENVEGSLKYGHLFSKSEKIVLISCAVGFSLLPIFCVLGAALRVIPLYVFFFSLLSLFITAAAAYDLARHRKNQKLVNNALNDAVEVNAKTTVLQRAPKGGVTLAVKFKYDGKRTAVSKMISISRAQCDAEITILYSPSLDEILFIK